MTADNVPLLSDETVRTLSTGSRRRQILDAAVKVMQRTGFHQMSMQVLANEARVSVGLIYKYFGGKDDILRATIFGILNTFVDQLKPVMDAAGDDPVERLVAGFRRYVEIVDENLDAVVLTYRENRTLDQAARDRAYEMEVCGVAPLRQALEAGIEAGIIQKVDPDLMTFDLMVLAHAWALRRRHLEHRYTVDAYIEAQTYYVLQILLPIRRHKTYAHLIGDRLRG